MNIFETLIVGLVVAASTLISLFILGDRANENIWIVSGLSAVIAIGIIQICGFIATAVSKSKHPPQDRAD